MIFTNPPTHPRHSFSPKSFPFSPKEWTTEEGVDGMAPKQAHNNEDNDQKKDEKRRVELPYPRKSPSLPEIVPYQSVKESVDRGTGEIVKKEGADRRFAHTREQANDGMDQRHEAREKNTFSPVPLEKMFHIQDPFVGQPEPMDVL